MAIISNTINRTANFSKNREHRYTLVLDWLLPSHPPRNIFCKMVSYLLPKQKPRNILWVMLNPSTADEKKDDPTVSRIIEISYRYKYTGLTVINLSSIISSDPKILKNLERQDLICEWPDEIKTVFERNNFRRVVCAWGGGIKQHIDESIRVDVFNLFKNEFDRYLDKNRNTKVRCLGVTEKKHPSHPSRRPAPKVLKKFDLNDYANKIKMRSKL